ncbi:MAG: cytochrome c biogenesis protein CcsA [Aquificae bacterium]|nr:cytochrome c biogenesis protein CcsA [Aquificota bacterium]
MSIIKKLWNFLTSMELMIFLVLVFAFSIGVATFIENDFGTETAWALVYGSKWFEVLWILLGINLVGNIIKYRMWKPKKLPAFMFHISFLLIFLGAALTRYFGYEGTLHIREGTANNELVSSDAFIQVKAEKDGKEYYAEKKVYMSAIGGNGFEVSLNVDGKPLVVKFKEYLPKVVKKAVEDPNGKPIIEFMTMSSGSMPDTVFLEDGKAYDLGSVVIALNAKVKTDKPYIIITEKDGKFFFISNHPVQFFKMADKSSGVYEANIEHPFEKGKMYIIGDTRIVPKTILTKGTVKIVKEEDKSNSMVKNMSWSAVKVEVDYDGKKKEVTLLGGGMGTKGIPEEIQIDGTKITLEWGAKIIKLPFSVYLKDFIVERYPGSMQPSSYESKVVVLDKKNNVEMPYRIYMNHTLDYGGYRFFQASYDPDEKGTILSVNHDPGKIPTYIGYTLLALGLLLNIFNPYSRFGRLARMRFLDNKTIAIIPMIVLLSGFLTGKSFAEEKPPHPKGFDVKQVINEVKKIDRKTADNFGTLVVQTSGGRLEPIDTLAIDVLNKISRKREFYGLNHNQIILGMLAKPRYWQLIPMIKVNHPAIKKLLGIDPDAKYFAFINAFDGHGRYKLAEAVERAKRKRPAQRTKLDKELIKVDERINIAYMVYTGEIFRIFPLEGDPNHTWYSPRFAVEKFPEEDKKQIRKMLIDFFSGIDEGMQAGNWKKANDAIEEIRKYQKTKGAAIYPSETKIKAEILYNRLNLFERLIPVYLFAGLALLVLIFAKLIKPSLNLTWPTRVVLGILILGFIAHTFNLILRGYVSGHYPWSNGYESLIYIAWTIIFAGILFARQSPFAVASTGILAGLTLFVAHLSWMDPQITNIVPVLKSYWLAIHVSVITASYGFLGLSALLGFITLILFIIRNPKVQDEKQKQIELSILEATRINEMSMIIGLALITVGNFLGGVWANESWGRYWGWDPKEVWALVTILVYTAVVHMRFVPKIYSTYSFAVASVLAYSSVIMTYFGVNFYLSGLHSYASGDPVPIPTWVYWAVGIVGTIIVLAYRNRHIRTI